MKDRATRVGEELVAHATQRGPFLAQHVATAAYLVGVRDTLEVFERLCSYTEKDQDDVLKEALSVLDAKRSGSSEGSEDEGSEEGV